MDLSSLLGLGQTALELGLTYALTVLALFLSYSMLNVCDLSTDGCFTFGAAVGAMVALAGHPYLSIPAAMGAGMLSGLVTAIRATGNNMDMVRSSSINPAFTITVGLCVANSFTGLSGCLLAQSQKACDINIGSGVLTIALASLLIGRTFMGRGSIPLRAIGVTLGSIILRLIYTVALRLNMPAYMLKLTSSVIVVLTISLPYLRRQIPVLRRRMAGRRNTRC